MILILTYVVKIMILSNFALTTRWWSPLICIITLYTYIKYILIINLLV